MKIGIIGLGLIGGSIAISIKERYPDSKIVVYNRSKGSLIKAFNDKVADIITTEIGDDMEGCDYIFLCTPVQTNISFLNKIAPYLNEHTILSDVGSTKGNIHRAVREQLPKAHFIGGHPMAGKEKSSYDNASGKLLKGAYYFLTPGDNVSEEEVSRFEKLIASIGCIPKIVEPDHHDFIVGAISHIPHIAAYTLVKLVHDEDSPEEVMRETCAGGFKDITRVASSDPTMWEEICLANRDNLVELMDKYIADLREVRSYVAESDGESLHRLFEESRDYRNSIIG